MAAFPVLFPPPKKKPSGILESVVWSRRTGKLQSPVLNVCSMICNF